MYTSEKDIMQAQKWLQAFGSTVKVTGKMTIGMTTALCTFQRKNNLPTTGELDKETWNALKKANSWWTKLKAKMKKAK